MRLSELRVRACVPLFLGFSLAAVGMGCGEGSREKAPPASGAGTLPGTAQSTPQSSDQRRLEPTAATLQLEATYPVGFSFLNGVRELSDGTILAADPLAQLLLHIDLDTSTADTLGRVGPGPQEYEQPDQVFPLPGDSSLLVDLGKAQLTVVHPDGTLGEGMPMMMPRDDGFPEMLHPRFLDEEGNIYRQAGRARDAVPPDSAAVTRFNRDTRRSDTVATVWLPATPLRRTQRFGYLPKMLEARDDWAVGPDGRVAVVRTAGTSVEWIFSDGRKVAGPPHEFESWSVSREDMEAQMDEMRTSAISSVSVSSRTGGVQSMSMSRGVPNSGDGPGVDDFEWAETFPVFRSDRTLISPRGDAWVERWVPVNSDSRWEVFDQEGIWRGSVFLPPRSQVIGFGRGPSGGEVAYVARTDDYDLKWLERYRVIR